MAHLLAFAGSNSSSSINYSLIQHTSSLISSHKVQLVNMTNYPFPMYSEDYERENGFSNSLIEFNQDIEDAAGIIISVNEHNGGVSAYFKNLMDWLSRLDRTFLKDKKVFLLATSPGKRGAISALEETKNRFARSGAEIVASFSLPSFGENFDKANGITSKEHAKTHQQALDHFLAKI